jgi:hypothetical protein
MYWPTQPPYLNSMSIMEREVLRQSLQANNHHLCVVSLEHMDAAIQENRNKLSKENLNSWEKLRDKIKLLADYRATADDLILLVKLTKDLGSVASKAYVKVVSGKPHIILKGYPGLRNVLTSTKYPVNNAKVISMGLGKSGAIGAAKSGGIVTIYCLTIYRVADYFLRDEATLSELIGSLATDVIKVGISVGASIAAASIVAGLTTLAIGPLIAVIAVGVLTSIALDMVDEHFGITERVIEAVDAFHVKLLFTQQKVMQNVNSTLYKVEEAVIDSTLRVIDKIIDEAVESTVEFVKHEFREAVRKMIYPLPRF